MTSDTDQPAKGESGHPLLWSAVALLAFVLIAVVGYKYNSMRSSSVIATAALDPDCMLNHGACSASLADGASVTIAIEPRPIIAASPLHISLQTQGMEATGVVVDFRGESMNMGLNQFRMEPQESGHFRVEAVLPVCVRNSMLWIAEVQVATPRGLLIFPFRLESVHP